MTNPRLYLEVTDAGLYITGTIRQLARARIGSFGDVFPVSILGWSHGRVAIKQLRYTDDDDMYRELMNRALEKEITALKLVAHPHVLPFYGLINHFQDPCIVMPWMENGSLRNYLRKHVNANRALILHQTALALAHLHSGNALKDGGIIVHGDIHAGNVLIDDAGGALLADFGLCKVIPSDTQASLSMRHGRPHGEVAYMAPELHDDGTLRSRSTDVFAFGMLIFETYAGTSPAGLGRTREALITGIRSGDRPQRSEVKRQDMTDEIWGVACDCWKQDPAERPAMEEAQARLSIEYS